MKKSEKRLHNLFMKMGTESSKENRQIYDNNLWLFDDKFKTSRFVRIFFGK